MKDDIYRFRGYYIPSHMMESLQTYITQKRRVGDFLTAVICNDFRGAVARADDVNLANLPAYICYLYNEAPSVCWGSEKRMKEWLGETG